MFKLYPLASASGRAIPLDILSPISHKAIPVTDSAMANPIQITTEELTDVFGVFWSTCNVILSFDETTPIAAYQDGHIFIPAGTVTQLLLPSQYLSAIAYSAGLMHVSIVELYDSLATDLQQNVG